MNILDSYKNLFNLKGKIALVTGGAGGIGSAISEGIASLGAEVIICGRDGKKTIDVANKIIEAGGKARGKSLDITDIEKTNKFVESLDKHYGKIDILVNCVGIQIEAPAIEYRETDWDKIFDINLKSAFYLSQAVARVQIPKGGGKQIHISSVRSKLGIHRGYIGYCTTKGGMNLMVKQLATEWAQYNITVNAIAPTFIRTELVAKYLDDPDFYNPLVKRIPLGRVGEPIDIGGMAMYLSSPASDFITGQIIFADGGVTACQ